MASNGIRDKVAIVGMGCCKFGENWDKDPQDMIVEAAFEAYEDAGNNGEEAIAILVSAREREERREDERLQHDLGIRTA